MRNYAGRLVLVVWATLLALRPAAALAQNAADAAADGGKNYIICYFLCGLLVGLAVLVVCRGSRRAEKPPMRQQELEDKLRQMRGG